MMTLTILLVSTILHTLPQGYLIECRSVPANVARVNMVVHLVAKDGTEFTTGLMRFVSKPGFAQDTFVAAIEDSGFVVRRGENDTVILG